MKVECIDNSGFEDLLTVGKTYTVEDVKGASVLISDNTGSCRWFGRSIKFGELST